MKPFEYVCPTGLGEALELAAKYGIQAAVMAGGTDLMVWLNARQINPRYVIDISRIGELRFIRQELGCIRIGALTTFAELTKSELVRREAAVLSEAARNSAGPQVRNLATIGGNLGTASPAGDLILAMAALDAQLTVRSLKGGRTLPLDQFLVGPKKNALGSDELITEIVVPTLAGKRGSAFQKLGNRQAMTIAIASAGAVVTLSNDGGYFEQVRVALGSVAPTVVRAKQFEQALQGKPATAAEIANAQSLVQASIEPITDIRGQAWYRREVADVLAARAVEDALAAARGEERPQRLAVKKKGWGVGGTLYTAMGQGFSNPYSLNMQMREDGSVVVQAGGCDIGQGSNTVLAMITAEALGIDVSQVSVYSADTAVAPYDFATVASRQTYAGGNAALMACEQIKKILINTASRKLGIPAERLVVQAGFVSDKENQSKGLTIPAAAKMAHYDYRELPTASATYSPMNQPPDDNLQGSPVTTFSYHATIAEVEVDTQTGVVKVCKLFPTIDAGKAINPIMLEGQLQGGAIQSIGWALREDAHPGIAPVGRPSEFNPAFEPKDLANYPIATTMDVPDIHTSYVEIPEEGGPFGAKSAGEICAMTAAPAVLNAIYDAVGVRIVELPASPAKVLRALQSKCQAAQKAAGV